MRRLDAAREGGTVAAADADAESWWDETRTKMNSRFDKLRADHSAKRAEWDLRMAENRADDMELDAADAIDFATFALDQAEYAVIDAVSARAEADNLAKQQSEAVK